MTREGPPPPLSNNGQIPSILLLLFWINVRCEIFERFGQFMTVVTWYIGDIYRELNIIQSSSLLSNLTSQQFQSNSSQRSYQETQLSQGDQLSATSRYLPLSCHPALALTTARIRGQLGLANFYNELVSGDMNTPKPPFPPHIPHRVFICSHFILQLPLIEISSQQTQH